MIEVLADARAFASGISGADEERTKDLVNAINHACHGHMNGEILFAMAAVAGANIGCLVDGPNERASATLGFYLLLNDIVRRTRALVQAKKTEPEETQ